MTLEMRCREMKILCLALVMTLFSVNADINVESIKGWFGELWDKGADKIQSKIDDLKETDTWQKISKAASKAERFAQNNKSGTLTPEVLEAHKKLSDHIIEFEEWIKTSIETFTALKSEKYKDQIELYEKVQSQLKTLKNHLSKKLDSLANGMLMIQRSRNNVKEIVDILKKDQGMSDFSKKLEEFFEVFVKAFEKLEKDTKTAN